MLNQGLIMEGHHNGGGGITTTRCETGLYVNSPNLISNFCRSSLLGSDDLKRSLCNTTTSTNNNIIPSSCYSLLDDEAVTSNLTHQPLLSSPSCTPYKLIRQAVADDYPSSSPDLNFSPLFSLQRSIPNYFNHLWAWGAEAEGIKQEYQAAAAAGRSNNNSNYSRKMTGSGTAWGRGGGGEDDPSSGHHHHNHHHVGVSAMKMKMKKQRRKVREPRFSFKTMTDVDVLDDGYKWRKYGQKVVKNTLHPRSYYRCTQDNCRVKKRVERLAEDPRMVITTYEGRHIHSPSNDLDESQSGGQPHLNNFFW